MLDEVHHDHYNEIELSLPKDLFKPVAAHAPVESQLHGRLQLAQ